LEVLATNASVLSGRLCHMNFLQSLFYFKNRPSGREGLPPSVLVNRLSVVSSVLSYWWSRLPLSGIFYCNFLCMNATFQNPHLGFFVHKLMHLWLCMKWFLKPSPRVWALSCSATMYCYILVFSILKEKNFRKENCVRFT